MIQRQTPEQAARQAKLLQESQERMARHQESLEAQKQARIAEQQAQAARDEQMLATRKRIANGESALDIMAETGFKTIAELNAEKRLQEQAEREAAEQARLKALKPFDVWFSTLSWQEQKRVESWCKANPGLEYPMPKDFTVQLKAV